jgi:hypothetical protein
MEKKKPKSNRKIVKRGTNDTPNTHPFMVYIPECKQQLRTMK